MSKVKSLSYATIISALERDGWIIVRQKDSHIRLEKQIIIGETLKITLLAHRPMKRSALNPDAIASTPIVRSGRYILNLELLLD